MHLNRDFGPKVTHVNREQDSAWQSPGRAGEVTLKKALVIEDDAVIRSNIIDLLEAESYTAIGAENGRVGLELARKENPALIICDIRMPEVDGFEVLTALRASPETRALPFIFLSAAADRAEVRKGMNLGADDYVTKPFTRVELLEAIRSRLERQDAHVTSQKPTSLNHAYKRTASSPDFVLSESVIVRDPKMVTLYAEAAKAAQAMISVLILGETGVGKEILAHAIHRMSRRKDKPFMALNCAALAETLLEGELFGNERGAFTGAHTTRPGLFEAAEGGTVFLDEVGELPMSIQVKLLRVLEERRVMRVGGRTPISIDVRFVSATNRDLDLAIEQGAFRQDLFFRLNGIAVEIPPLRERPAEILPFIEKFIVSSAEKLEQAPPTLSPEAADILVRYTWPGNVRELKNVVDRAVVLSSGSVILPEQLPAKLKTFTRDSIPAIAQAQPIVRAETPRVELPPMSPRIEREADQALEPSLAPNLKDEMVGLERQRIIEALDRCAGNQTAAAELLGISRRTLVSRISDYDLPRPRKRL
jgi:two-component system, NtrC family, response regulator AtoC